MDEPFVTFTGPPNTTLYVRNATETSGPANGPWRTRRLQKRGEVAVLHFDGNGELRRDQNA
jgi:hypothetical protein